MTRGVEERVHRILRKSPSYTTFDPTTGAGNVDHPARLEPGERVLGVFQAGGEAGDLIITTRAIWLRDRGWVSVRYVDIEDFASPASKTAEPVVTILLRNGERRRLRFEAPNEQVAAVWTFVHFLMRVVEDRKREAVAG